MISQIIVILICVAITQAVAYYGNGGRNLALNYMAGFALIVQWVVFIHAGGFFGNDRTEKFYDLTGTLTFLLTLGLSLYFSKKYRQTITRRQIILSSFVAIWAIRLGWFLFARIMKTGGDARFDTIKEDNSQFLMAWTLNGVWVFLCLLPVLIVSQYPKDPALGTLDYVGFTLWVVGFFFEVMADYQKTKFREDPANKGKFITSGLWSTSRHPNYFGEIVLWLGITLSAFKGTRAWISFITPVFVACLLIFVSGIPMQEERADAKWGNNESYQIYKNNTPTLIPFIGPRGNSWI